MSSLLGKFVGSVALEDNKAIGNARGVTVIITVSGRPP